MSRTALFVGGALLLCSTAPAFAEGKPATKPEAKPEAKAEVKIPEGPTAKAVLKDAKGATVGEAVLRQTPHGILLDVTLTGGLPAGVHAFHIHDTGKCEPPFKTAGGHFNPAGHKHGILAPEGKHGGDLPNIHIGADGKGEVQVFIPDLTLESGKDSVLKEGGTAFVVHAGLDDYHTDPTGGAGDRIACGVIEKSAAK